MITITELDKKSGACQHSYADTHALARLYLASNGYQEREKQWVMEKDNQVVALITEQTECTVTVPNPRFVQMRALRTGWQ